MLSITPAPSSEAARQRMVRQRSRDTMPELMLRKALYRRGLRYRVHRCLIIGSRRSVDISFGPARVAVEVRGCFWHRCPEHATAPKANGAWWAEKLTANVARDLEGERLLNEAGWELLVVWEHEIAFDVEAVAERIMKVVAECRATVGERRH